MSDNWNDGWNSKEEEKTIEEANPWYSEQKETIPFEEDVIVERMTSGEVMRRKFKQTTGILLAASFIVGFGQKLFEHFLKGD